MLWVLCAWLLCLFLTTVRFAQVLPYRFGTHAPSAANTEGQQADHVSRSSGQSSGHLKFREREGVVSATSNNAVVESKAPSSVDVSSSQEQAASASSSPSSEATGTPPSTDGAATLTSRPPVEGSLGESSSLPSLPSDPPEHGAERTEPPQEDRPHLFRVVAAVRYANENDTDNYSNVRCQYVITERKASPYSTCSFEVRGPPLWCGSVTNRRTVDNVQFNQFGSHSLPSGDPLDINMVYVNKHVI